MANTARNWNTVVKLAEMAEVELDEKVPQLEAAEAGLGTELQSAEIADQFDRFFRGEELF